MSSVPERINLSLTSATSYVGLYRSWHIFSRLEMRHNIRVDPPGLGRYQVLEWAVVSEHLIYTKPS